MISESYYIEQIEQLKKELLAERSKNTFTNAMLEGGNLSIWAINSNFKLINFNQNYFNELLSADEMAQISFQEGDKLKSVLVNSFWQEKYEVAMKGESLNFEIRLDYEPGEIWKSVFLNPTYNETGEIIAVSGLAYDITEKMQTRIDIVKNEEKFRTIFESFQDLYFRCDFKGKIMMLSPSVKEITGFTEESIIGKDSRDYYIYSRKTKSLLKQLIQKKSIRNIEFDLVHESGKKIPCICNLRIVFENQKPSYIEGVARDITNLKRAHEQLQYSKEVAERSLKVKERFLANMSHEIRTPLNGIMGMLHLLNKSELKPKQQQHLKALKGSADILMEVLNDLLDISKIEAGKMVPKHANFNVHDFMEKISLLYFGQAEKNGLKISFDIKPGVPEIIFSDETKLLQIFSNLISNAIKFTLKGGEINVILQLEENIDDKKYLFKGIVSDTGIGISSKDRRRLFKSFTQLDSSNSKSYKGTGLGLYLSKRLTRLFKGDIGVESQLGKGSSFWFTFNTSASRHRKKGSKEKNQDLVLLTNSPRILIVDDNAINLQLAAELLKKSGGVTNTAGSGFEALKKCKKTVFDLIVMDIQMPDMDGVATTLKIRQTSKNKKTPIIAMTAYSTKEDSNEFLEAGMDDYLSKPINPSKLLKKVKRWTEGIILESHDDKDNRGNDLLTVNYSTLATLAKYGGQEMVDEALKEFEQEFTDQLKSSKQFFKLKKLKEIAVIFHTLKGNAGTLGLEKISASAEILENGVKTKKYHIFEGEIENLQMLFEDFKKEINAGKTKISING
ncbi:response regulator [Fulvivirga sp. M361]|uniref:response regulator n=1 Tax=Fulvivirga sp. M361 TaxID=2594266 RepID=UPI00117AABCB|nr:response regulator [Fulvivirga sp. M361]TRX62183.1 response regulator [Fulvivirga sp. M361]